MNSRSIVIIGGGYTGLSAAWDLVNTGWNVTVLEAEPTLGGLAGTFELKPGIFVERFYHHWFASDTHILDLIKDIGHGDNITRSGTNTGLYYANSIFRLASPLDLLRFTPIPLIDRIRTGIMALAARRIKDWKFLEDMSAADWIRKWAGPNSYRVIWEPLIKGKFGKEAENISAVWFWNKIKLRGSSRDDKGREELLYFKGGFGAVTDALESALTKKGVSIFKDCAAKRINSRDGRVTSISSLAGEHPCNACLVTIPLPNFVEITPELPIEYKEKCLAIRYLGNICLVLRLKRSLSQTYWLNVSDPTFPFVGVIEHTNMDSKENYDGEHLAYISKYLPTDDFLFKLSDDEFLKYCIPFIQKIFPDFNEDWLHGFACWRASNSQPVITKNYSALIPEEVTPIEGLYLSTMAQIYPEDRGTNYAVREGRRMAEVIRDAHLFPEADRKR